MTALQKGTRADFELPDEAHEFYAVGTQPFRNSTKERKTKIASASNYAMTVAATALFAGSAGGTGLTADSSTKLADLFPGKPVSATSVFAVENGHFKIQTEDADKDDEALQVVRRQVQAGYVKRNDLHGSVAKLIRAPYLLQIMSSLEMIQTAIGEPRCAVHIERLFNTIQTISEVSPYDPFARVLLALYDSLAFENRWNTYSKEQYKKAQAIVSRIAERTVLHDSQVNKAIMDLESAGFSTVPFAVAFDAEES